MLKDIIANIVGITGLVINFATMMLIFPCKRSLRFTVCALALSIPAFHAVVFLFGVIVPRNNFLFGLAFVPIMILLFQGKLFQKVFALFFQFFTVILRSSLASLIGGAFSGYGSGVEFAVDNVLLLMMHAVYIVWIWRYGRRVFERLFASGSSAEWAVYSAGAVFSFAVLSVIEIAPGSVWQTGSLLVFIGWSFGVLCYAIINTHEKTAQKYREIELSKEKAMLENLNRTKSEFFANINHEMRTLLTIIATDIELAEQFTDEGNIGGAKELLREAWQETMETANRVTDALVFARSQETSKPMEPIDFGAVIEATLAVFEPLIKKHGNTLTREITKLPPINGNADMLASALVNLLTNANKHTSGGIIHVTWDAARGLYRLMVSDNGSGISPELLPHVFERGVTDGNGTGIGLVIVKNIAELHGGEVALESGAGKGTAVTIMFPMDTEVKQ